MAPINLPDGTEVSEVILPDGASASEVVAPDGRTVFSAIPEGVVDNFEEVIYEDQNRTLSDIYDGDLTDATRQQSTVQSGSYALEVTNGAEIASTSGLPNYPSAGDSFDVRFYIVGNEFHRIGFGVQNATSTWIDDAITILFDFRSGQPDIKTTVRQGGSTVTDGDGTADQNPSDQWCRANVSWTSSDFTVELFDSGGSSIDSVTVSDSTYSSGGIGFGGAATAYFDEWFIQ